MTRGYKKARGSLQSHPFGGWDAQRQHLLLKKMTEGRKPTVSVSDAASVELAANNVLAGSSTSSADDSSSSCEPNLNRAAPASGFGVELGSDSEVSSATRTSSAQPNLKRALPASGLGEVAGNSSSVEPPAGDAGEEKPQAHLKTAASGNLTVADRVTKYVSGRAKNAFF